MFCLKPVITERKMELNWKTNNLTHLWKNGSKSSFWKNQPELVKKGNQTRVQTLPSSWVSRKQTGGLVMWVGGGGRWAYTCGMGVWRIRIKSKDTAAMWSMVVSWEVTSCTYRDRVIFLQSPLKPSKERCKESLTRDAEVAEMKKHLWRK